MVTTFASLQEFIEMSNVLPLQQLDGTITSNICFNHSDLIISAENISFSNRLNEYLRNNVPMDRWVNHLQENCSIMPFVQYNYEALYYNNE